MNAVGIDVSKGKSTIAVLRPFGEIIVSPFDVFHLLLSDNRERLQVKYREYPHFSEVDLHQNEGNYAPLLLLF